MEGVLVRWEPIDIALALALALLVFSFGVRVGDSVAQPTVRPPRDMYTPAQRLEQERHCEAECYPEPVKVWQAKICVCESGDKAPGFEVAQ